MKKYFLFFANRGIAKPNFYGFVLVFIAILVVSILSGSSLRFLLSCSVISAGLFIANNILIYSFKDKYFVMPFLPYKYFKVLVFNDEWKALIDKPLWVKGLGKYDEYTVEMYDDYQTVRNFKFSTVLEGRGIDSSMMVTVTLVFYSLRFDGFEVLEAFLKKFPDQNSIFSLEKYLMDLFLTNNHCSKEINEFYEEYLRGEISEHVFLENILGLLTFPKDLLFTNIFQTRIFLSDFKSNSCCSKVIN